MSELTKLTNLPPTLMKTKIPKGHCFTRHIHYYEVLGSTMDEAKKLANKGVPEGTAVIAKKQALGRGRFQRKWFSPLGGIYLSLVLRPNLPAEEVPKINFLAAVAVARTLKELYRLNVRTKWPNDVLIREKKICGILTETGMEGEKLKWVILGIGVNVNLGKDVLPRKTLVPSTSLQIELKKKVSLQKIMKNLLENLEKEYFFSKQKGFDLVLEKWKAFSATLGRKVKIVTPEKEYSGKAIDIDEKGVLILELENGKRRKFLAGDCIHLPVL